jgi:osmotically-inducible protein OsmY
MTQLHRIALLLCAVALSLGLGGCAGVLVVGGLAAAGGAGYEAAQERGVVGSVQDIATKTDIESAYVHVNPALQLPVTVTVYDGRVLLTGRVPTPEMKAQARQIASQRGGVRAVYDEIEVRPTATGMDAAEDAMITARLRSEMILDADIRSGNFNIDTTDHSVYLIGSARSQAEIDRATQLARYVSGVRRVVSYMDIRSGVPIAARTTPSSVAVGGYAPSSAGPAAAPSGAPIERQKL